MVMRLSSPEWQRSSLACKSAVVRLAVGACIVAGVCGTIGERECAIDGTGAPLGWFICHPP
jgi:hypothetical protein